MTESGKPFAWRLFDTSFIGDVADPDRATTPWSGHRWFGYDLVRWQQPTRVVELGTHWGCSFFAFSQAVMEGELGTECHAVDTWKGDPDAGTYGPEVYESFTGIVTEWFGSVDTHVHRMSFDEALAGFEEDSIDLLHIDGYHSYEAVSHDFETWLPKVAKDGIVLFHDVNPSSGYGSATYWKELREVYPGFEFPHNFGLGVLLPKGVSGRDYLLSDEFATWMPYYTEKAGNRLGHLQQLDHIRMIEERDQVMADQTRMIDERDHVMESQVLMIGDRDQALVVQTRMIDDRDKVMADQTRMIDERDQVIVNQQSMIDERDRAIATYVSRLADSMPPSAPGAGTAFKDSLKRVGKQMPEPVPTWLLRGRRKWWQLRAPTANLPSTASAALGEDGHPNELQSVVVISDPSASPGFDSQFYADFNVGLDASTATPFEDYLKIGVREGRPPTRTALGKAAFEVTSTRHQSIRHRPMSYRTPDGRAQVIHDYSQLSLDRYELVTVDFWQTLVLRNRPAESVKLDSARFLAQHTFGTRRLSGREHYAARLQAESSLATERRTESGWGEYHAREALTIGLKSLLPELGAAAVDDAVEAALAHEISSEVRHASLNQKLAAWIGQLEASGIEVAVVSDFYLDGTTLAGILERTGFESPPPIFASCDVGSSKAAGGRLFVTVREQFGVKATRHLHLGDNEHSDVVMQLSTGGAAVLVPEPPETGIPLTGPLEAVEVSRLFAQSIRRIPVPAPREKVEDIHNQRDLHMYLLDRCNMAGWQLASLPALLTIGAMELARKVGLDRVNYVSREGALLARVHEAVSERVGMPDIRAVHIPSSRQATFAPSLDGEDQGLLRLWSFYRHQSPNDLLKTLGLEPSRFRSRLLAHGLDPDGMLWSIWAEPAFVAFLQHKSVDREIKGALERQRKQAKSFLGAALGEDKAVIIVDTGWRGTIQDNLALLFPDREFQGLYLGLLDFLNPQPENVSKGAIGPDSNSGDDVSWLEPHVGVIERLLTPPIGSTSSYSGGRGIVLDEHTGRSSFLDVFQDGVIAGSTFVADAYVELGGEVSDLKDATTETMRALLLQPSSGAADAFFSVAHSDDFGTAGLETSVALMLATERLALRIARGSPPPDLADLFWPPGLRRCFPVDVALSGWW